MDVRAARKYLSEMLVNSRSSNQVNMIGGNTEALRSLDLMKMGETVLGIHHQTSSGSE